jgi:3-isopropylmalate/(R)-2-methylmalate dehydratase small subunit
MQAFTKLTGIAAPLPMINVDTDMIIPKQFLKTILRTGLGKHLFDEMRFTPEGKEIPDFVLNREPYRKATVLVSGDNFGCGSSREHAPWALLDFGIRCVIAPSFADIFYNNCFQNGILPLKLPKDQVDQLMEDAKAGREITVDLEAQIVKAGNKNFPFTLDEVRRNCLLKGLDSIGLTLQNEADITAYEKKQKSERPWV